MIPRSYFLLFQAQFLLFCLLLYSSLHLASPTTNITLLGDASRRDAGVSLTMDLPKSAGRVVFGRPLRFFDPVTNSPASFSTRFSFSILPSSPTSFGDGLAFFITSYAAAFSPNLDRYLGIMRNSAPFTAESAAAQETVVTVEFDTAFDLALGDINDNHVGLDINTIFSFTAQDAGAAGIDLKGGRPMTAWVEYNNDEKMFRVWLSYSALKPANPLLAARVDLSRDLDEFMYVGFSASNGHGAALHLIDRWVFRTFTSRSSPSENDGDSIIGSNGKEDGAEAAGSGAAPFNIAETRRKRTKKTVEIVLGAITGGAVVFALTGLGVAGFVLLRVRRRAKNYPGVEPGEIGATNVPGRLSLTEVKLATNGFHGGRVLGQGGSGTVYKGVLASGQEVAVKRFERRTGERVGESFGTELTAMVGSLRHKNLVQLQGWCCDKGELVLVYEHLPNGSLDMALHDWRQQQRAPLKWEARMRIVLGVASALAYLHEDCERQIIHRDVKCCNILLDASMNAKLCDFGLAELYERTSGAGSGARPHPATMPAGTIGYLAPEYVHSGVPTEKLDVYSFGVVALEVATGRRPIEREGPPVLVDWVWGLWGRGVVVEAADPALGGKFDMEGMQRMLLVGLACVHPDHRERPRMKAAVRMIKGEAPLPVLPAKKPPVRLLTLEQAEGSSSSTRPAHQTAWHAESGTAGSTNAPSWATPCLSFGDLE